MGHNNVIRGTENYDQVIKLVVLGHNNVFHHMFIRNLQVCGHNNHFKSLHLSRQPNNTGFQNKFSNVNLVQYDSDDENDDEEEPVESSEDSSVDSDSSDNDVDEQ